MFNYQSNIYEKVVETWHRLNVSTEGLTRNVDAATERVHLAANVAYEMVPLSLRQSKLLSHLYAEWKTCYDDTYKWIHPKLVELSNTTLHYGTGVSVGVIASVLILVFVLTRFLPAKLKNLGYLLMFFGSSVSLWMLTTFGSFFSDPMTETFIENWQYFVGYIVTVGVLSFAVVYRYGPVTDERSLRLIQWFLQLVGLVLVYNSTQIREVSIALIIILLTIYNFPKRLLLNERSKNWWYRFFPPKIKLLTEEEYIIQGNLETKRELDKLRDYCRSPECQTWKIISKLKSPQRFAEFILNGTWHVSDREIYEHETQDDVAGSDPPSDTESELVFVLGSPSRTVHASFTSGC